VNNINNVRREASRHFRKKREYLKYKINKLPTYNKSKKVRDMYRGTDELKGG
jgi:hypothetical protein